MPLSRAPAEGFRDDGVASAPEALLAAQNLIEAELDADHASVLHPSLGNTSQPRYAELLEAEHAHLSSGTPRDSPLDLSRYELPDAPATDDPAAWNATLDKAHASAEYLRGRQINLNLLEAYGKNAWLIGNSQLEDELRSLEAEIQQAKLDTEQLDLTRQAYQANALSEMRSLETAWKTGMGSMLETQAAAERLRVEILEQKRQRTT